MAAENTADVKESKRRRRPQTDEAELVEEAAAEGGKGYATPGRRSRGEDETENKGNVITSPFIRFRDYLKDVRSELDKVVWPTRYEVRRLTTIVIVALIATSLALGLIGFIMNRLVEFGLNTPAFLAVGLVIVLAVAVYVVRRDNAGKRGY